jgi:sugar phosphate isomerase/epimerase
MTPKFFAPEWGNTLPFDTFCKNVKEAGYDGIETAMPFDESERNHYIATLKKYDLEYVGQYYQSFEIDLKEHADSFEKHLYNMLKANPLIIDSQTGKDFFTYEQNEHLFDVARKFTNDTGVRVMHETHRGKSLFAAHISKNFLSKIEDLRICLDISHWTNVHETLLEDQQEAVELAISRADHIHSRVGHTEGPQINDPRAPEWSETLAIHVACWDKIAARHKKEGTQLTITTEFGPDPYMPALPYTKQPVVSQWDVNVHMLNMLKERYQ